MNRIERIVAQDLYFKWLHDEMPNATVCLKARNKVTVREPYGLKGLWVRLFSYKRIKIHF